LYKLKIPGKPGIFFDYIVKCDPRQQPRTIHYLSGIPIGKFDHMDFGNGNWKWDAGTVSETGK